ncbi:hypothetical protein HAX54_025620 [Datura stramonium]|uniref:Uncharacterized protein n=1 Tax=Datura stramonium TaxID=4076 RepID=A0ABS8V2C5_DATST|nr:hypothetical protein [Datura stramonium]
MEKVQMSPRHSNFGNYGLDEESGVAGFGRGNGVYGQGNVGYPAPTNAGIFSPATGPASKKKANGGEEVTMVMRLVLEPTQKIMMIGREEFTFGNKQNGNDKRPVVRSSSTA